MSCATLCSHLRRGPGLLDAAVRPVDAAVESPAPSTAGRSGQVVRNSSRKQWLAGLASKKQAASTARGIADSFDQVKLFEHLLPDFDSQHGPPRFLDMCRRWNIVAAQHLEQLPDGSVAKWHPTTVDQLRKYWMHRNERSNLALLHPGLTAPASPLSPAAQRVQELANSGSSARAPAKRRRAPAAGAKRKVHDGDSQDPAAQRQRLDEAARVDGAFAELVAGSVRQPSLAAQEHALQQQQLLQWQMQQWQQQQLLASGLLQPAGMVSALPGGMLPFPAPFPWGGFGLGMQHPPPPHQQPRADEASADVGDTRTSKRGGPKQPRMCRECTKRKQEMFERAQPPIPWKDEYTVMWKDHKHDPNCVKRAKDFDFVMQFRSSQQA